MAQQKGQNKIEIRGLSSSIDTQTIRVSGLGDARLFDVTCTHADSKATLSLPGNPAEVKRTFLVKKAALECEKAVRERVGSYYPYSDGRFFRELR